MGADTRGSYGGNIGAEPRPVEALAPILLVPPLPATGEAEVASVVGTASPERAMRKTCPCHTYRACA